jgi:hypothetical protein
MKMVKAAKMDRTTEQFKLRLPTGLRIALEEQATINRRSINSEIIVCLEKVVGAAREQIDGNRT